MESPRDITTAADVDAAIRAHWLKVCDEFPNALTPQVARKVAEDFDVSVTRIFESFRAGETPSLFGDDGNGDAV